MADQKDPSALSAQGATFLSTEHWHLLGMRSMAWNESFSRMGIFLNTLSAAVVALALIANASGFGGPFSWFALAIFPVVLFLGIATYVRLVRINLNDFHIVAAQNRLRRAYVEFAPEIEPYLTSGTHDDRTGVFESLLLGQMQPTSIVSHLVITTPSMLLVVDAVIAATAASFAASRAGAGPGLTAAVAIVVALALGGILASVQARAARQMMSRVVRFPTPDA
jgi:hypothetical protein